MIGLVSSSPTLYRLFCAATGFGGTTQRALAGSEETFDRTVTVLFDSNVAPGLPWRFEPEQREVTVHLGEPKLVFFNGESINPPSNRKIGQLLRVRLISTAANKENRMACVSAAQGIRQMAVSLLLGFVVASVWQAELPGLQTQRRNHKWRT
jgi:cytochrome c oxidase assembly protein Cox11